MRIKLIVSLAATLIAVMVGVGLLLRERVADTPAKPATADPRCR